MRPTKLDCVGVLLTVLLLVVAPVAGTGGTVAPDAPKRAVADVTDATDGTGGADGIEREETDDIEQDEADNGTPGDDAVLVSNARLTVAGTTISVEQALFSVEEGTGTAFLKTLSVRTADGTANVTNLRVAVGERIEQRLASETAQVEGAQFSVSAGHVDLGGQEFQLRSGVLSGRLGAGTPTEPNGTDAVANETDAVDDRTTYEVTNFTAPDRATVGESINVSARVTNPGEGNDSEVVRYVFGEVEVGQELIDLEGGESTTVNFSVSRNSPGNYTHGVRAFDSNASATIEIVGQNETSANATRPAVTG